MHESKRIFLFANQKTIGVRKFKKCRMQETFVRSEVLTKMRFLFLCSNHSSCLILYTHTPLRPCFFFWLLSQEPCRHWSQLFQFTFTPPQPPPCDSWPTEMKEHLGNSSCLRHQGRVGQALALEQALFLELSSKMKNVASLCYLCSLSSFRAWQIEKKTLTSYPSCNDFVK